MRLNKNQKEAIQILKDFDNGNLGKEAISITIDKKLLKKIKEKTNNVSKFIENMLLNNQL